MSGNEQTPETFTCDLCPAGADPVTFVTPWSEAEYALHLEVVHRCEFCQMLCETELSRTRHWWRIHGKEYSLESWYKVVGDEAIEQFGRFVDVIGWQDPVESLRGLPSDPERLCTWLYPMCVRMLEFAHPEVALYRPPEELASQALYTEVHFRAVVTALSTARFKRLKGCEAKGLLLAKALALPEFAPGYAEQQLRGIRIGGVANLLLTMNEDAQFRRR